MAGPKQNAADDMQNAANQMQDAAKETMERTQDAFRQAMDPDAIGRAQSAMGVDPQKMQETLRTMTERSREQSQEAYRRLKTAAEEATRTMESTVENAHNGSLTLSRKALEAMRSNAEMGFEHLEKLASAKSVSELIELQTGFVRRQMEAAADQAREMQAISQEIGQELLRPGREAAERMKQG